MRVKKSKRDEKLQHILFITTELYLNSGIPVGSKTLQEKCCPELSTATIRNYFSHLEEEGFLKKNHTSGGRIPTDLAFRYYVDNILLGNTYEDKNDNLLRFLAQISDETQCIVKDLQHASEILSEALQLPAFFSAPRFDNDVVVNIKLVPIDESRIVIILITEFGQILTDTLWPSVSIQQISLSKIESYLQAHIGKIPSYPLINKEEEALGKMIYNEVVVRYLTRYCNFSEEDIYFTGFSKLLQYESFQDPKQLAKGLALFENRTSMHKLLHFSLHQTGPSIFIGNEITSILESSYSGCSILTIPYQMNQISLGAFGILGPTNMPYDKILSFLKEFAIKIQNNLTKSFYKFKLSFRRPNTNTSILSQKQSSMLKNTTTKLISSKEKL